MWARSILRTLGTCALALPLVVSPPSCRPGAAGESSAPVAEKPSARAGETTKSVVPGVVLICIDTLRADAIDPAGGATAAMPALDEFARGATTFVDASSSSSWTAPSVSTILTGLLPSRHGVHSGCGEAGDLATSVVTIAETLKAAGWSTAALTAGGWVAPENGLAQGFDAFGCTMDISSPEAWLSLWARRRASDKPFFLFLHTYAAHSPYGPVAQAANQRGDASPEARRLAEEVLRRAEKGRPELPSVLLRQVLRAHFLDGGARPTFERVLGPTHEALLWNECMRWVDQDFAADPGRDALADEFRSAYVAGLRSPDDLVARALLSLKRAGLPRDAAVVVVGDHGEAFGEHGTLSHGRWLYDELVRVPLIVRAPTRMPVGKVVKGSCGLVDVFPTILDLAGLPAAAAIDGRSLAGLSNGETGGHPVIAQEIRRGEKDGRPASWRIVSVRTEVAKFMATVDETTRDVREEIFDLVADPGERRPLAASEAARFGADFVVAVESARKDVRGRAASRPTIVAASIGD